jgi:ribulose-5-phosphate 4-epimerase/fuculose-1-phosphate aldolase
MATASERVSKMVSPGRAAAAVAVLALASSAVLTGGHAAAQQRDAGSMQARHVAAAGVISTVAGGVGGPAKANEVALGLRRGFCGGASYAGGSLYIADFWSVRKVNPRTGWLTTPAGTGVSGPVGDGHPAASASMETCGVAVDHTGNLVIADTGNERIRVAAHRTGTFYGRAMTAGDIYAVAGNGREGFSGDGGPATAAEFYQPEGVTVDGAGNLVIADTFNQRVRVAAHRTGTFYGRAMTAGDIYTVAGTGSYGFNGDGGSAAKAKLFYPSGVAVDSGGNLLIADSHNERVRVVAAITGTFYGQPMTAGHIYTVAGDGAKGSSGDGGPATAAKLRNPRSMVVDGAGNLVIADTGGERVRVVAADTGTFYGQPMTAGDIYTVAGTGAPGLSRNGGPATKSRLNDPQSIAVDGAGNLVIALGSRVRVVAASTGTFYGQPMTAGDIYTVAGTGNLVFSGDGGPATRAEMDFPGGVAAGGASTLAIADSLNQRIRVVPASTGSFYGQAMTARHIYSVAGNGTKGFSGDGGPATAAELNEPFGVALDRAGNVVIADTGNQRIRVVAASTGTFYGQVMTAGNIYTVAGNGREGFSGDGGPATSAEISDPEGVTVDRAGNVVIADTGNQRIRVVAASTGTFYGQVMTAGNIYTVAGNGTEGCSGDGGPATSAEFSYPRGVAADGAGNLVIACDSRIWVVAASTGSFYGQAMMAGDIYIVAGNGSEGFSGDGGPATAAELNAPDGMAADGAGNLVIADAGNLRIRVVAGSAGTFYGQAMTTGHIYTVAGDGRGSPGEGGFSGDGGLATRAEFSNMDGVAVDSAGDLVIADSGNYRIREVSG